MKKRCFFEALSRKLQSEKGNAAVITMSVILVLTALGTVSLLASAMNVRMGGRTLAWSEEYYTLDTMAEKLVQKIEEEVLIPAEEDARKYVMNRLDRVGYDDMRAHLANPDFAPATAAQKFFNNYYTQLWTYDDGTGRHEYTVLDYERCIEDGSLRCKENGSFVEKSINDISRNYANTGRPETDAANAYRSDLEQYTRELFERIYFHLVARRLEYMHNYDDDFRSGNIIIGHKDTSAENYGRKIEFAEYRCTYRFIGIQAGRDVIDIWNKDLKPSDGAITLYILARDENVENREVRVKLEVVLPEYDIIEKTIYTPVYGNPVWANALTVRGSISFGKSAGVHTIRIMGDVYASGPDGISVYDDTTVNIYGNVYTAGNLQAAGSGGKLRVWTSATRLEEDSVQYTYKKLIYTDDYIAEGILIDEEHLSDKELGRIDRSAGEFLHQYHMLYRLDRAYTANQPEGTPNMPFVFKDGADQGNVYCDSLEVSEGVVGAELQVAGNLWTMDDIQMDGERSTISIGCTEEKDGKTVAKYSYIGLNGESSLRDPNTSSSVINNFPFTAAGLRNSVIRLNSNFVVPGVAFYNFFDSPDPADRRDKYYKSAESVTSRTQNPVAIINAYVGPAGDIYYNQDGDEFALLGIDIGVQTRAVIRFINDVDGGVFTNIRSSLTEPSGYVAGVALVEKETGGTSGKATVYTREEEINETGAAKALVNSSENWLEYLSLDNSYMLFRLYTAKTKMLGRYVESYDPDAEPIEPIGFDELVRRDMLAGMGTPDLFRFDGNGTLNVTTSLEGIVYCTGDLTITGNGEFRGAIICEGDVSIKGDVTIRYDESVIRRKLRNSAKLREFFSKGQMGQKLFDIEEYSTTSGERIQVKRYRIAAWKETPRLR